MHVRRVRATAGAGGCRVGPFYSLLLGAVLCLDVAHLRTVLLLDAGHLRTVLLLNVRHLRTVLRDVVVYHAGLRLMRLQVIVVRSCDEKS